MDLNLYRVIYLGGDYRDIAAADALSAAAQARSLDARSANAGNRIVAVIDHFLTDEAGIGDAYAAIRRVRELHTSIMQHDAVCAECDQLWPCDTICALDGERAKAKKILRDAEEKL